MKYKTIKVVAAILAATLTTGIYAKGGTAKPPTKNALSPFNTATLPDPGGFPGELGFTVVPALIHQFDDVGILQNVTVSGLRCPSVTDPTHWGGTATLNGITITIPCNMVIQMPANTFTWADMVNGGASLALDGSGSTIGGVVGLPSFELEVVGNIVGTEHIAALMYISQESLNGASGVINRIDYATGNLEVDTGNPLRPVSIVQINDPNGRFGRVQSPDPRFSVDDENPTIHAATGYPMCVPRTLTDPTIAGNPDDPLCPQKNRPKPFCRNFSVAGVAPPISGDLGFPAALQVYCSQYVMKSLTDATRVASDATPDQQAPFEVGDFITFSGTLIHDRAAQVDYISAHTIEANVGIYTQPGTQPSYLAIGEFGVGTLDPCAPGGGGGGCVGGAGGVAQETTARIFLEAETSDVKTPVDIYMIDVDASGVESNRWITPFEMTGECNPALAFTVGCLGFSGGITTQNTGPQPQRARIRATKPPFGLMSQPTRNVRVVARSLCQPINPNPTGHSSALDQCLAGAPTVANGLVAGQYSAPVFEYIFPEGTKPGDPVVPNDFWHLPFLRFGDGMVGPLTPTPW
jgi:hypothetical protein